MVNEKWIFVIEPSVNALFPKSSEGIHTLLHTPYELTKHIFEKHIRQFFKILREHIHDRIQGVVTRRRHPFGFLEDEK